MRMMKNLTEQQELLVMDRITKILMDPNTPTELGDAAVELTFKLLGVRHKRAKSRREAEWDAKVAAARGNPEAMRKLANENLQRKRK